MTDAARSTSCSSFVTSAVGMVTESVPAPSKTHAQIRNDGLDRQITAPTAPCSPTTTHLTTTATAEALPKPATRRRCLTTFLACSTVPGPYNPTRGRGGRIRDAVAQLQHTNHIPHPHTLHTHVWHGCDTSSETRRWVADAGHHGHSTEAAALAAFAFAFARSATDGTASSRTGTILGTATRQVGHLTGKPCGARRNHGHAAAPGPRLQRHGLRRPQQRGRRRRHLPRPRRCTDWRRRRRCGHRRWRAGTR